MKKTIQTPFAPQAFGTYSQAIQVGKTVYLSGQIPFDPITMTLVSGDFRAQAVQVMKNLAAVTDASGGSLASCVKLTIYVTDLNCFPIVNEVMAEFFTPPYPARTTVEVAALPKDSKIEIDAIMVIA